MNPRDPSISKRVPRFVEEYCKHRVGTRAALDAGWPPSWAHVAASNLLKTPKIQALIREQDDKIAAAAKLDAALVLREWVDLATADPSKIIKTRQLNCRHCWGVGHAYQWGAREYARACDDAAARTDAKGNPRPAPPPTCEGGFGWVFNAEPNAECPECQGEGVPDVVVADMDRLTGPERKLIASVKKTKDGIEVKMRNQDEALAYLAKHLGMLVEKRELTGKDGQPLTPATIIVCGPDGE